MFVAKAEDHETIMRSMVQISSQLDWWYVMVKAFTNASSPMDAIKVHLLLIVGMCTVSSVTKTSCTVLRKRDVTLAEISKDVS